MQVLCGNVENYGDNWNTNDTNATDNYRFNLCKSVFSVSSGFYYILANAEIPSTSTSRFFKVV